MVSMLNIKCLRIGIVRATVQEWDKRDALVDAETSPRTRVSVRFLSVYSEACVNGWFQPSGCAEQCTTGPEPDRVRQGTA